MACVTANEVLVKQPGEVRQFIMDFSNLLVDGETINAVSSITDELRGGGTSDLTVYNEVSTSTAVSFWVSGGTHGKTYRIEITVTTNLSQTLEGDGLITVRDT